MDSSTYGSNRARLKCRADIFNHRGGVQNYPARVGVDLANSVLQIHNVDCHEKVVAGKKLNCAQMHTYFKSLAPCLVGMEACATSHYWARILMSYGHKVELIAAQFVKPHGKGDKNELSLSFVGMFILFAIGRAF